MVSAPYINFKIVKIGIESFEKLKLFHVEQFENYEISDESFKSYLSLSQYEVFCAVDKFCKIIGYVILSTCQDEADIVYICVCEKYKRLGIASELLIVTSETIRLKRIFLEVACDNASAINFYKKNKFEIVSIRKNYITNENGELIDSFLMCKN